MFVAPFAVCCGLLVWYRARRRRLSLNPQSLAPHAHVCTPAQRRGRSCSACSRSFGGFRGGLPRARRWTPTQPRPRAIAIVKATATATAAGGATGGAETAEATTTTIGLGGSSGDLGGEAGTMGWTCAGCGSGSWDLWSPRRRAAVAPGSAGSPRKRSAVLTPPPLRASAGPASGRIRRPAPAPGGPIAHSALSGRLGADASQGQRRQARAGVAPHTPASQALSSNAQHE